MVDDPAVLINQFIAAAASEGDLELFSAELAGFLANKSVSLLLFIQALGPTLTSESTATRTHATHCLAATLSAMDDATFLLMQDVSVLLQFLLAKLDDEKLTVHVLNALSSLVGFKHFRPNVNGNLIQLLEKISDLYEPRKHLAKVRYESFHLVDATFKNHRDDLIAIPANAEKFASTFVHIASGEKDPRNLLMSFKLNTAINKSLPFDDRSANEKHDQLLTKLFDVAFCYFPISFTPPANDPYKITSQDLKTELRTTIASQSQFAQDTFPSLFEKLTSTNPAVRNDVLQCICSCVENYSSETLEQYWVAIWDALKFEILHNDALIFKPEADSIIPLNAEALDDSDENKILIYTLIVLQKLAQKLEHAESFEPMTATIISDLKSHFTSLNEKTSKQAVILICSTGTSSTKFFNKIVQFLFSFEVWGKFIRSDKLETESETEQEIDVSITVTRQRELIDYVGFVITASKVLAEPNDLWDFKDHLLIFMGQLLQTSSNLEKSLKCKITQQLTKMLLISGLLSREDAKLILNWLGENMASITSHSSNSDWQSDLLLQEIVKSIIRIMTEGSEEMLSVNVSYVIEIILPMLLDRVSEKGVLDLIDRLCVNYQFLEVLSIRYLNKLAYDEYDREAFGDIIESLTKSFVQTQAVKPFLTNSWQKNFIPRFLGIILKRSGEEPVILELAGQLFGYIVRFIEKSKHQSTLEDYVSVFLNNDVHEGVSMESLSEHPSPKITLFKHLLAKIDKKVIFPDQSQGALIDSFIKLAHNSENEYVRLGYLQVIALLVNKFTLGNDESVSKHFLQSFEKGPSDSASLEIAIWILKGLIVKLDPSGSKFLDLVVTQLTESEDFRFCKAISSSFTILMSDLDIFTNKENSKTRIISGVVNLNARLLYKQQIFESLLQKLLAGFTATQDASRREVSLATLAVIINNVSPEILKPHLKEVLPLVLNGLTLQNSSVLKASLQTFKVIIQESPELIQENLSSLLSKLIFLSTHKMVVDKRLVNNETIRLLSLDCILGVFTRLEHTKLVRYQSSARMELARGLDDKKRNVRKKTTDVRQVLYELGH
ncbi:ARM repeat-containing protein [Metschnikowia bicuspidata var. bicuspidata NRRL YB-4993]|uniref:MMS19 nucleotide excision repair protein n=1 Tax=Metschnikowia bicuspidata var. bicuspidata NRRL YB-4993 TaxID=869754 RepID=A0A1A0H7C0_9ASCO|nr:ARM repeat-containing protein [Metschnikowia bicuspidata var. bicuspidata NRRL YB-4993]OBA19875.1 ARM repeat-containing protein [Metschnikowia bicuspidata var. bicuspidata NRRL YB-4993]